MKESQGVKESKDGKDSTSSTASESKKVKAKDRRPPKEKKENFAKKYLDPAARGELNKQHSTGIPKLAVRKTKGNLKKDDFPGKEMMENAKYNNSNRGDALGDLKSVVRDFDKAHSGKNSKGGKRQKQPVKRRVQYKKQENLSHLFQGPTPADLNPMLIPSEDRVTFLGTDEAEGSGKLRSRLMFQQKRNIKQDRGGRGRGRNDRGASNYDIWGDPIPEEELNSPWPSMYMAYTYDNPHDESKRETKPTIFPKTRESPPLEFLEKYKAFAYVTDVPHPVVQEEGSDVKVLGEYEKPMHRHEVHEIVANAFNVPVENVFASTMTSAFVGFESAKAASDSYNRNLTKRIIEHNIECCLYSERKEPAPATDEEKKFVSSASAPECILQISNVPGGMKIYHFIYSLRNVIQLSPDDVHFVSPTTMLLKTNKSQGETKDVQQSSEFGSILKTLSRQILRVQPAKLGVVHDKFLGPARQIQAKKTTNYLVADGDMPSSKFFLSHGQVLHLSNLHPSITKKDISKIFQPYCILPRDVNGSIEFVKSIDGHPTGRAYVGFDRASEAEKAWNVIFESGQKIEIKEHAPIVRVRPVKEKSMLRGKKLGERTERTQEELLYSLQSEWKEHVDPEDIEYLEAAGIPRGVLEDAFMAARYNNPTFGVEDLAREGERMHDDKVPGQAFAEFVQCYIETAKEVATSREEPGGLFKSMFLEGEEIDYSLFDEEEERVAQLEEERSKMV